MQRLVALRTRSAYLCARYASTAAASASQHDYIVVGAGSAGCVLTHRLSEAGKDVCLLEAGPADNDPRIHMPLGWGSLYYDKTLNWNYWTVEQSNAAGRRIYAPRGKTLGGTSSINALAYVRPHPLDLDQWAFHENSHGWSYADSLPYFKKSETYHPSDDYPADQLHKYRGTSGPLHVTSGKLRNKVTNLDMCDTFFEAAKQFGLPSTIDMNGYRQEGATWYDCTYHQGLRMSTSTTYLKLAMQNKTQAERVHLHTNSLVTRLLFDQAKKRVIGVETADVNDRTKLRKHYAKEVVLSGGTFNSPHILQLSGIGNAQQLKQAGVEPVVNLPGVGQNLQEHMRSSVVFECTPNKLFKLSDPEVSKQALEQWTTSKTGLFSSNGVECGGFVRTSDRLKTANIQVWFGPAHLQDVPNVGFLPSDVPCYSLHAISARPKSRGFIKLRTADPFEQPIIDLNMLSDERDLKELIEATKLCIELGSQKAFDSVRKRLYLPNANADDKQLEHFVRNLGDSLYHSVGTCKMGDISKDASTVVDARSMRVYGVDGLRVVDASVMPSVPSCNLNAPTIMIAERASDLMLGNKLLAPENVPTYVLN